MRSSLFLYAVGVFVLVLMPLGVFADESIPQYDVSIAIQDDSSVRITEEITYDFDDTPRRGIYRSIPRTHEVDGEKYRLNIIDTNVFNEAGEKYVFEVNETGGEWEVIIGSGEPTLTGEHTFILTYTLAPGLLHLAEHDAFQWNAIGFEWGVPIEETRTSVSLPTPVPVNRLQHECFVGKSGSTKVCSDVFFTNTGGERVTGDELAVTAVFSHEEDLGNRKGMTVALYFPKNVVSGTGLIPLTTVPAELLLILLVIGFIPLYGIYRIYRLGGDHLPKRVVRQYDAPKEVSLSDAGLLLNRQFGNSEFVAELLSLAIRGYIQIVHFKKREFISKTSAYMYVQRKPADGLSPGEKLILEKIFDPSFAISKEKATEYLDGDTVKGIDLKEVIEGAVSITLVSKMKEKFHTHFKELKKQAREDAWKKGFFEEAFTKSRKIAARVAWPYFAIPLLLAAITVGSVWYMYAERLLDTWIFGVLAYGVSFIFLFFFAFVTAESRLPRRTTAGVEVKNHLLGLKEYVVAAEKERMEFHFDPKKNPELFEKLLPWAVILGMQKRWTAHLKDLEYEPTWYMSTSGGTFNPAVLGAALSSATASTSVTSSGGSVGAAGGGFGGGGGGAH